MPIYIYKTHISAGESEDNSGNKRPITFIINSSDQAQVQRIADEHRVQTKKEGDRFMVKVQQEELGEIVAEVSSQLNIDEPYIILAGAIPVISNPCTRCGGTGEEPRK